MHSCEIRQECALTCCSAIFAQSVTLLKALLNYNHWVKLNPCEKCAKCDFDKKCWNVEMNRKISSEWVQPPYLSCISEMLRWAQKYAERLCSPSQIRNWEIKIGKYLLKECFFTEWRSLLIKIFFRIVFPIWFVTDFNFYPNPNCLTSFKYHYLSCCTKMLWLW